MRRAWEVSGEIVPAPTESYPKRGFLSRSYSCGKNCLKRKNDILFQSVVRWKRTRPHVESDGGALGKSQGKVEPAPTESRPKRGFLSRSHGCGKNCLKRSKDILFQSVPRWKRTRPHVEQYGGALERAGRVGERYSSGELDSHSLAGPENRSGRGLLASGDTGACDLDTDTKRR